MCKAERKEKETAKEPEAALVLQCVKCSKTGESLLKCSGCGVARYCSAGTCMCVQERGERVMCCFVCRVSARTLALAQGSVQGSA
jgi:hypothetical protein